MIEFIADIGANHDGSLERALRLIQLAAESGADVVKFQHFRAERIVSAEGFAFMPPSAHQAEWRKPVVEVYRDAAIPWEWTPVLAEACAGMGVEFMSTPYDLEAVKHLDPYVRRWKVGSGDITYRDLLMAVARTGKPVILSTGASTLEEVVDAAQVLRAHGCTNLTLLHCTTNYSGDPGNVDHANVLAALAVQCLGPNRHGLSDHLPGPAAVYAAVALGATVIEKHLTDDRTRVGPDHHFALEPREFAEMVRVANDVERALGRAEKRVTPAELETVIVQRRCWRAARDLPRGHVLQRGDLEALRPCPVGAVDPMTTPWGWVLRRPLAKGEALMDGAPMHVEYVAGEEDDVVDDILGPPAERRA